MYSVYKKNKPDLGFFRDRSVLIPMRGTAEPTLKQKKKNLLCVHVRNINPVVYFWKQTVFHSDTRYLCFSLFFQFLVACYIRKSFTFQRFPSLRSLRYPIIKLLSV